MNAPQPAPALAPEPFVSYSINYEDVVLRRLIRARREGFFVDVGAQHPVMDNDFYGLYTLGWHGINIEPNPSYFALLQKHRPRDLNLQLALSEVAGQPLAFFEVQDSGLSTCDEAQATACAAQGYVVRRHDVRSSTLAEVLDSATSPHIDILKVDVEGLEESVLRGNDWERHRPSVIMVEVTYPETSIRRPTGIRDSLEAIGYRHIYFDNLNDFFADATFDVPPEAILPPNVFDAFVRRDVVALREENASIRTNFQEAERYAHALEAAQASLGAERAALQAECMSLQDALGEAARSADALGQERSALLHEGAVATRALARAEATAASTAHLAMVAILGRSDQVRALLAADGAQEPEQGQEQAMPDESRELVTIAGEGVTDGHGPPGAPAPLPDAIRAEMTTAYLQALSEQNARHLNDIDDLRHENRRLLASLRQAQGENLSLGRALGPSYATRDELLQLREALASLQGAVGSHHHALSEDFDARVRAEVDGRVERMARQNGQDDGTPHPALQDGADTRMLDAVLNSTSWRVTRPLRAIRKLFGPSGT